MLLTLVFLTLIGYSLADNRIIGGNYAAQGQFPHQIAIELHGRHHCGGSIISEWAALTAAHCTNWQNPDGMVVIAGTRDLSLNDGYNIPVSKLINHPQYSHDTLDYDMAIILFSYAIQFSDIMKPITMLETQKMIYANEIAITSGWGAINNQNDKPSRLKFAQVELWSIYDCQKLPGFTDRMLCAGDPSGQVSSCQGDSGGPLTVDNKLVGVVSWGFGCGTSGRPAVYTDVGNMRPWIRQTIGV